MKKNVTIGLILGFIIFINNSIAQNVVNVYLPDPCSTVSIPENFTIRHFDFKIYPNPNNGTFIIKPDNMGKDHQNISLTILDVMGKTLYSKKYPALNGNVEFNDYTFSSGIYYIRLQDEMQAVVKMFIVL